MRKLAILGLILLIVIVVFVTMAFFNVVGIRDVVYNGIQGTVLQPIHDWSVSTWIQIGNLGFTYIAATFLGIAIGGGLFLVFIAYGLFWQKLIQKKWLHKTTQPSTGGFQSSPTSSIPITGLQSQPIATPIATTPQPTPVVEEKAKKEA